MADDKKYGWFSAQSKKQGNGTMFYRTPAGDEVEISACCDDPDKVMFFFADKVCVGEITRYLRKGQVGNFERSR